MSPHNICFHGEIKKYMCPTTPPIWSMVAIIHAVLHQLQPPHELIIHNRQLSVICRKLCFHEKNIDSFYNISMKACVLVPHKNVWRNHSNGDLKNFKQGEKTFKIVLPPF